MSRAGSRAANLGYEGKQATERNRSIQPSTLQFPGLLGGFPRERERILSSPSDSRMLSYSQMTDDILSSSIVKHADETIPSPARVVARARPVEVVSGPSPSRRRGAAAVAYRRGQSRAVRHRDDDLDPARGGGRVTRNVLTAHVGRE